IIGVDPSHVMTQAARRLARAGGFGSRLVHAVGDGARRTFAANRLCRVFAVTVLLHVANSAAILREMVRVARPGGLITVQDQDFGSLTLDHPDRALTARIMGRAVGTGARTGPRRGGGFPEHKAGAVHARHAQAAGRERDTA